MTRDPRRSGFTLLELLVVIAILSLLLVMLIPAVARAKVLVKDAKCKHNLHGAAVAFQMYLHDSNDVMPEAAQMPSAEANGEPVSDDPRIADVLARFLGRPELLRCPADNLGYFEREGSSYEYHTNLGGKKVGTDFLSEQWGEASSPVLNDYAPFHWMKGRRRSESINYLFTDGHVGDFE